MTIQALSKLFTANHDNEVVVFATNLKTFVEALKELEPNARNYAYYMRQFDRHNVIVFIGKSEKVYKLQKVFERE